MSKWRMPAAVLVAALAVRLAHYAVTFHHPFHDFAMVWIESDMHQFLTWARHLAGGDWLDRDTFRAWFSWQQTIAPPEVWSSWYGAHVYYQPPLYPYVIASVLALTGSVEAFRLLQMVLGSVCCVLLARLAARLSGAVAGWIAGLGAALYAPFIVYDAELLRGTVVRATHLLLLLALLAFQAKRDNRSGASRMAALAGAALGLAYLADPAVLPFGLLALVWLLWAAGPGRAAAAGLFVAGALAAMTPLVARNLAVGAPILSSTTRGPLAFVMGNAPDSNPAGAFIPASTGAILSRSGYAMGATMKETLRLYDGDYRSLLAKQWSKMRALWSAYEVPDNPSLYYAARVSPVAAWGLPFLPVAALGLAGLGLSLRGAMADPGLALLPAYVVGSTAIFLLAHVVSRYREGLALALLALSAHAVVFTLDAWRSGRRGAAVGASASAVTVALLLPWSPPPGYGYLRPAEYVVAARAFEERGEMDAAVAEMDAAIEAARREEPLRHTLPPTFYLKGEILARAGRHDLAVTAFREALREDPQYGEAAQALERSLAAMGGASEAP